MHRCNFAPAAAVDREPESVMLEGVGIVPGGEVGRRDGGGGWQAIPPLRSDMVGMICRFG